MKLRIELFGIPRDRAGTAAIELADAPPGLTLGGLLLLLAERYPRLAAACFAGRELLPECAVNLDGRRFTRESTTPLADGMTVMILSADAGG